MCHLRSNHNYPDAWVGMGPAFGIVNGNNWDLVLCHLQGEVIMAFSKKNVYEEGRGIDGGQASGMEKNGSTLEPAECN
jgi:hypothetical protein